LILPDPNTDSKVTAKQYLFVAPTFYNSALAA
jgi:hypothetical protein